MKFYPRGQKKLYKPLQQFGTDDMVKWLSERGVKTKTEPDLRMFPQSNSSQTVIDCFEGECEKHGVKILRNCSVKSLKMAKDGTWIIEANEKEFKAGSVIIATGSSNAFWEKLRQLGLKINSPVPSLFTFNISDQRLKDLPGISFQNVGIKITKTRFETNGPLLITHWGLSGPAVLKLSAFAARELEKLNYKFSILVNFFPGSKPQGLVDFFQEKKLTNPNKFITKYSFQEIPNRYWARLLDVCNISADQTFGELSNKAINKLTEELTQAKFGVSGKSTFKEEFVTCGGVDISEVNLETMQSKNHPGLYFAGEVLDIDALTGGFNFQACWTTGWLVSEAITSQ